MDVGIFEPGFFGGITSSTRPCGFAPAKVESRILEFGGTREELEQEKKWVKAAKDLLERARQFKNRGGSLKAPEYEKLFQQANSLGAPLVPEFNALFENYNK